MGLKSNLLTYAMTGIVGAGLMATPASAVDGIINEDNLKGIEYREVGPFRGGRVTTVVGVVGDSMTYYMGSMGGVWKTSNAGRTWENVSDGSFGTASVGSVDVSPTDPNVVVVGMGESPYRHVASSYGDGVYLSTDAAKTWKHIGLKDARQISSVKVDPKDPNTILVAVQGSPWEPTETRGVYKTTDAGENWERVLFSNENSGAIDMKLDPNNSRIIYASLWDQNRKPWGMRSGGPGSGLYKSLDGGDTWNEITNGLPDYLGKMAITPSGAQDGLVYALVEAGDDEKTGEDSGLYKSTDGGENWSHVTENRQLVSRSWYYMHLYADPNNADTIYSLNAPLMKSTDGGKSWSRISTPHGDHHGHWINPDNSNNQINANDGGATITFDGGKSWTSIHNQPTAQFYRVNTDNSFPYRMFSGQQDNSSVGIASKGVSGDMGEDAYITVAGCENAHVAMDRDNPRYIYGGCYLGQLNEYDSETGVRRNVEPYRELGFGVNPKERTYRWKWNAPVLVSTHDTSVIYHASNVIHKSSDRGVTWTDISPDLTKDQEEYQQANPVTITREITDSYNALLAVTESPYDANVIWAGSDDGMLSKTEDGGTNWEEVTPNGDNDGMINSIEISPHDPQTVYVAAPRYKYDDHKPYIFKTTNNGRSWKSITDGIPEGAFVRVVREDPVRKDMLYAGTETGLYISLDGGDNWQPFQRNLPVVPVTDIQVKGRDLAISTQGRAFWVLDDLSPLRQGAEDRDEDKMYLYKPELAYDARVGNMTMSAVIYYTLGAEPDLKEAPVKMEILDGDGNVIRTMTSDAKTGHDGGGSGSAYYIPANKGMNKATWDYKADKYSEIKDLYVLSGGGDNITDGRTMRPGDYTVRVSYDGEVMEQPLSFEYDPRVEISNAQLMEKYDLTDNIDASLRDITDSIKTARDARNQASAQAKDAANDEDLKKLAQAIVDAVDTWEAKVVSVDRTYFQDTLNWPDMVFADLQDIYRVVDAIVPPMTKRMEKRFNDVDARWQALKPEYQAILSGPVAAFNEAYFAKRNKVILASE
ncbi:MAG: hypothetical protein HOJ34_02515 [Kordiimonadaceae bacterium]|nr:hypothetical protein [Kordiimonadaceae bacterium]MBT6328631.1 hypothetical protein [Kordiimonadaceae bacterium]